MVKEYSVLTEKASNFCGAVKAMNIDLVCKDASGGTVNLGGVENPETKAAKILYVALSFAAAALNCALDVGTGDAITDKDKTNLIADADNTSAGTSVTKDKNTGGTVALAAKGSAGDCIVVTQGAQNKTTAVSLMVLLGYEY